MNKILLLFISCSIFICPYVYSQSDFRDGYIITNANDTIYGEIDYREGSKNFHSCVFKKNLEILSYTPNEIKGYRFNGDKAFLSETIEINNERTIVFLEAIVKGRVSLYKHINSFFIEKGDSFFHKLQSQKKEVVVNGKTFIQETNTHRGILNYVLSDCKKIKPQIRRVRLFEKELTILVEDYNNCFEGSNITYKSDKPWLKSIVGLSGIIDISQLNIESDNSSSDLLNRDFDTSSSLAIGLSIDILSPRLNERISLHGEVFYLNSKYKLFTENKGFVIDRDEVFIKLEQIKIPLGIRYTFPEKFFAPYFNLGVSSIIHISSDTEWIRETEIDKVVKTYESEAFTVKENQFGIWGGIGVVKSISDKLSGYLELRYEKTDGITQNPLVIPTGLKSSITNFYFLIGIRY